MSRSLGSLTVDLIARVGGFQDGMSQAERAAQRSGRNISGSMRGASSDIDDMSRRADAAGATLRRFATIAGAAFAGVKLTQLVRDAADLNSRYEQLGGIMNVVGRNAGLNAQQVNKYAKEVQAMGITMMESRQTVITMTQAQLDLSRASELARAAQDAAAVAGVNSSEALRRIISGIQSNNVEVLRGVGLNVSFEQGYRKLEAQLGRTRGGLSEAERAQARMNVTMEAARDIAGSYEASMDSAAKQMGSNARYLENLQVMWGAMFSEVNRQLVFRYSDALKELHDATEELYLGGSMEAWADAINTAADAAGVLAMVVGVRLLGATASYTKAEFAKIGATNQRLMQEKALAVAAQQRALQEQAGAKRALAAASNDVLRSRAITQLAHANQHLAVTQSAANAATAAAASAYAAHATAIGLAMRGLSAVLAAVGGPVGLFVLAAGTAYTFREELGLVPISADKATNALDRLTKGIEDLTLAQSIYRADVMEDELEKTIGSIEKLENKAANLEQGISILSDAQDDTLRGRMERELNRVRSELDSLNNTADRYKETLKRLNGVIERGRAGYMSEEDILRQLAGSHREAGDGAKEAAKEIEKITARLEQEHRQLTMTSKELLRYNLVKAGAADPEIDHALSIHDTNESLKENKRATDAARKAVEQMLEAEEKASAVQQQTMNAARRQVEVLGRQVAVVGQGKAAQEALNRELFIENQLRSESYRNLLPHQQEEYRRLIEQQYDLQRELERQAELAQVYEANWLRGVERVRDGFGDFFERMIVDGKASFSDLTDLFKKMIAEMIATAAANRIMIGLGFAGGSAAAAAGGLGSGSGAGGLSNLFSVAQMANTAKTIWSGVQGIAAGEGLSGFSGLGGQLTSGITLWADKVGMNLNQGLSSLGQGMGQLAWGLESTGYTIAEAVGIQGISAGNATLIGSAATAGAGWAGGYAGAGLGRDLFGKEGSGWGATGGAMLGAYVGSIIPGLGTVLGSALGGLVGGVVDSIFGSSAWNTTRGGLQLGFDESGEFDPMQWTRQTKKGGLFSSTRRRYRFHELDEELDAALRETYSAALDGVREMYGVLGVAVEDGVLEGVQIATLQIGTSGKSKQSQEQIEQQISQWFADLQEAAVQAIDPSLSVETLSVYAGSLASVNEVFGAIGLSAYEVSVEGGRLSAQLLQLAGGIENLLNATDFYYQNFYSEQERLANLTGQTAAAFEALGYALPDSAAGFRNLVESIDRTTEAGQAMFLQLLNLAPAMHTIASAAEAAARAVVDTAFGAVQRSVAAQQKRIQDAHAAHMRSLNDMASTASANINEMVRVSNALDTAMRRLRGTSDETVRSLQAQAVMRLNSILMSGRPLSQFDDLQDALDTASNVDPALYASLEEFERTQGRTANLIARLEEINGKQLSTEERLLNAVQAQIRAAEQQHERQMSALSMQLSYAQSQLDALNGLDSTIMGVTQAVNAMNAAMVGALKSMPSGSAKANTPANNKTIVDTLYETILGREADDGGRVYWQYQLQSGALDYSNVSETLARAAIENPDETQASKQAAREFLRNQGIPGFAAGGYHTGGLRIVGERGPELEATGPSRIYNARQTAEMLGGGARAAQEIAQLRKVVERQGDALRSIAKHTQQTARRVEYLERWDYDGVPAERVIV